VPCKRQESEEGRWGTSSCPKAPENSHARAPCDGKSRAEPQRVLTSSSRTRSARPQRILRAQRDLCVILYRWIRHRPHQSSCLLLRHRCCLIGALKARTWSTIAPLVAQPNHLPLLLPMELWSSLLNHHLHRGHQSTFADPAGCSSYGARHATCKDKAPRKGAHKQLLPLSLHSALYVGQERTPRTCSRNCGTLDSSWCMK
jgi:hypothetical protein